MKEHVVCFGDAPGLVGILTEPDAAAAANAPGALPGIVFINAGLVHRVGPNRLYVKAARRLAAAGHPVLRFDLSGLGDSPARTDAVAFRDSAVSETTAAMALLGEHTGARQFVLAGICSGADIAFQTACARPEVVGAVLINGQSLHDVTDGAGDEIADQLKQDRQARWMLKVALFDPARWKRLLGGKTDFRAAWRTVWRQIAGRFVRGAKVPAAAPGFQAEMRALVARGVRVLLAYSEGDPGVRYLEIMLGRQLAALTGSGRCTRVVIPAVDHTFTPLRGQQALIDIVTAWSGDVRAWQMSR